MSDDVPRLVREAYSATIRRRRDDTAAFERAVGILLDRYPEMTAQEARREVAMMLAFEPDAAGLK